MSSTGECVGPDTGPVVEVRKSKNGAFVLRACSAGWLESEDAVFLKPS